MESDTAPTVTNTMASQRNMFSGGAAGSPESPARLREGRSLYP